MGGVLFLAQTMANFFLALEANLDIIPVLNKIDLQHASVPTSLAELKKSFDFNPKDVLLVTLRINMGM